MTRACVIIKKSDRELIFYRHYDGYPSGLGTYLMECLVSDPTLTLFNIIEDCGLELTDSVHGDIEYLYIIDFDNKTFTCSKNDRLQ